MTAPTVFIKMQQLLDFTYRRCHRQAWLWQKQELTCVAERPGLNVSQLLPGLSCLSVQLIRLANTGPVEGFEQVAMPPSWPPLMALGHQSVAALPLHMKLDQEISLVSFAGQLCCQLTRPHYCGHDENISWWSYHCLHAAVRACTLHVSCTRLCTWMHSSQCIMWQMGHYSRMFLEACQLQLKQNVRMPLSIASTT